MIASGSTISGSFDVADELVLRTEDGDINVRLLVAQVGSMSDHVAARSKLSARPETSTSLEWQ